jgi:hypothetical protein
MRERAERVLAALRMPDNPREMAEFRFDFDFLKNRYDYELQRKEQLTTALTLPVAVLTGLGGAIVAMARSFSYRDALVTWLFSPVLVADGIAFFVCLVYLARAYHPPNLHIPAAPPPDRPIA